MTQFLIWGAFSLPPLLNGNYENFARAGSIVVAFAVLNLSRTRSQYETSYREWLELRVSLLRNRTQTQLEIAEKRTTVTADIIYFHLAQCCSKLNIDHVFEVKTPEQFSAEADRLNGILSVKRPFASEEGRLKRATELESQFQEFNQIFTPWLRLVWRLEVILLILGTLQWGYGDLAGPMIQAGLMSVFDVFAH